MPSYSVHFQTSVHVGRCSTLSTNYLYMALLLAHTDTTLLDSLDAGYGWLYTCTPAAFTSLHFTKAVYTCLHFTANAYERWMEQLQFQQLKVNKKLPLISKIFWDNFIFGTTSHSEDIIIENEVFANLFSEGRKYSNICSFKIILSEIFFTRKFHKLWYSDKCKGELWCKNNLYWSR